MLLKTKQVTETRHTLIKNTTRVSLVHRGTDTVRHGGQSLWICPPGARTEGIKQQTDEVLTLTQACPSRHNRSHKKRETGCRREVPPGTPSNTARREGRFLLVHPPVAPHTRQPRPSMHRILLNSPRSATQHPTLTTHRLTQAPRFVTKPLPRDVLLPQPVAVQIINV